MSNFVIELLQDIGLMSIIGIVIFYPAKKYISNIVKNNFDERLEIHKHHLSLITENAKFNFQRKIQDFNLYTIKKHEKYVQLHQLILEAYSWVDNLYGLRTEQTLEEFNENDITKLMDDEHFPQGKKEEIISILRSSKREFAIEKLKEHLRLVEFQKAQAAIIKARNYHFSSLLYFSDGVEKMSIELLNKLFSVFNQYAILERLPFDRNSGRHEMHISADEKKEVVKKMLDDITKNIKSELSIGYY